MSESVKVRLNGDCYVGGVVRAAGEVVEVPAAVAEAFGKPVKDKPAEEKATAKSEEKPIEKPSK